MPQSQRDEPGFDSASRPRIQPVHTTVPGRARFKVQGLFRSETLKSRLEINLPRLNGIRSATINTRTGTLLVHFDPSESLSAITAFVENELTDLPRPPRSHRVPDASQERRRGLADTVLEKIQGLFKQPFSAQIPEPLVSGETTPAPQAPWHALDRRAVLARLDADERGLSAASAQARLARYGPNTLPQAGQRSELSLLIKQFTSPLVLMLGVSAGVSLVTGGVLDAAVIAGVTLVNGLIGFITERQSEKTIAALTPTMTENIRVLRDGADREIAVRDMVIGDIVILRPGDFIPADARLLEAERLTLDESALTGESMSVEKAPGAVCREDAPLGERGNMVYMGTLVTGGGGRGIIVGTALNTEIGRIQALASDAKPPQTPLERQLNELGNRLTWMSSAVSAAVFGLGLLRGYSGVQMLNASVALAVAAVPEGLPTVATTTLALGIRDMRSRKVLVRQLDAVETLGSVQFFCFDKTGTLTSNHMTVVALQVGLQCLEADQGRLFLQGQHIDPLQREELRRLFEALVLCNETEVNGQGRDFQLNGSATERALIELALQAGVDVRELRRRYPRVSLQHRTEDRPYMVSVHRGEQPNARWIAVKGSPEQVLDLCRYYLYQGRRQVLDPAARMTILQENERMAGQALRVLGVACQWNPTGRDALEGLIWLGLAGMADPLRAGMDTLIKRFHRAGIKTAMITGDQSATAYAIAKQLDLADGRSIEILDSGSLDKLDPELLSSVVQHVQVFSRVSPAHKLQIVQALQKGNKVVAMTGDGINDGPALRAADLGVAMGDAGTDVARSLADVVLEDDNLATMEVAVRHGRSIYHNVRKAVRFLVSTNLSEIEVVLAGIGLGLGQPLNAMQLLWIDMISDIFPALALAMEPPEPGIMERPPRDPQESVIAPRDLRRLGLESLVISGGALASYIYALMRYGQGPRANTHAFMTLGSGQLLHAFSSRSEHHTLLDRRGLPPNRYLNIALGISLVAQCLTVLVPGLRKILGNTPITPGDGLVIGTGALLPLLINETLKKAMIARGSWSDDGTMTTKP